MNTKIIKFDLNKYKLYENIKAKQKDTKSRFLLFQLLDGSIPFDLTNRSVRAYMIKPDGNEIFNDLIINNYSLGYCTLELTNQVLAVPGKVKIELMITEEDKKLTSSIFELEVIKSINSEKSIVSTNEFTALLNGLASLSEYDNYKNSVKAMELNKADKATVEEKFISVEEKIKNNSEQLETNVQQLTDKINEVATTGTTTETVQNKVEEMAQQGLIQAYTLANGTVTDKKISLNTNIVFKEPVKNLINTENIIDGYYVDYSTGQIKTLEGYSVTDFERIKGGEVCTLSLQFDDKSMALEQLAFYDINENYISGLPMTGYKGSAQIESPSNAVWIRLTLRTQYKNYYQLEYGSNKTSLEEYRLEIDEEAIPKSITDKLLRIPKVNVITVKQDDTGDFNNLRIAIESITDANANNLYQVNIHPGIYDVMSYFTSDEINNTGFIGLIKPNYVSLIGVGNCDEIILNGELDDTYSSTTMKRVSTLVTYGEGELRNLTVKAKNLRYAVHDDYQFENTTLKTENCKFLKYKSDVFTDYPQPYGGGLFSGMKRKFKKCYFFTDSSSYPFSFHNNVGLTSPVEIEIEDCQFEGVGTTTSICFLSMGSGTKDKVKMKGCRLNGAKILLKENIAGVGCDFELTGYSNDKVPYDFTVTNGKQYVYNFVGEHLTVHNSSSSVITKGTPVKYSLQANNSGVIPLATADDKSVMLGVAFEDIQPQQRGTIRIDGYLAIKDTSLSGLSEGNKVGVVNGVLAKVTSGDYIGVVVWGSWIKLNI